MTAGDRETGELIKKLFDVNCSLIKIIILTVSVEFDRIHNIILFGGWELPILISVLSLLYWWVGALSHFEAILN